MYSINQYNDILSQNLLPTIVPTLDKTAIVIYPLSSLGIENTVGIQSQFLYLYLMTAKLPFMSRKYPSKKKIRFATTNKNTVKISSWPKKSRWGVLVNNLFHKFIPKQLSPEFPSITLTKDFIKIIIWNASLEERTFGVQTNDNLFIQDIPIYYKFLIKKSTLFEISFWIGLCEFLKPDETAINSLLLEDYQYDS